MHRKVEPSIDSDVLLISDQEATRAVGHAMALDESVPETHMAAALVKQRFERDWRGAERESRRAIELDANNAVAHERYAVVLSMTGRFAESIDQARVAESLDPLSPRIVWRVAVVLYYARRYDESIAQVRRTLDIDPTYDGVYQTLGQCYQGKGQFDEAIQAYLRSPRGVGLLPHVYAMSGRTTEAQKMLAEMITRQVACELRDLLHVRRLRVRGEIPHLHVLEHASAKGGHG